MNYQLVSTSDVTGDIEADLEALLHRVNALVAEGYEPVGGPVVRNNPEVGDYFIQAMYREEKREDIGSVISRAIEKAMPKKPVAKKPAAKNPAGKK